MKILMLDGPGKGIILDRKDYDDRRNFIYATPLKEGEQISDVIETTNYYITPLHLFGRVIMTASVQVSQHALNNAAWELLITDLAKKMTR